MNEQFSALKLLSNYIRVDYEKLIANPDHVISPLFKNLAVNTTSKTQELMDKIYVNPNSNIQELPEKCHPQILAAALSHKNHFHI